MSKDEVIQKYETLVGFESKTGTLFDVIAEEDKKKLEISKEKLMEFKEKTSGNDWKKVWGGMPEVEQEDLYVKNLNVNFKTMEDYWKFGELIGASLTERTKSVSFPVREKNKIANLVWLEKEEEK